MVLKRGENKKNCVNELTNFLKCNVLKYVWINMELSDNVHILMLRPEIRCEKRKYLPKEVSASLLTHGGLQRLCIMPYSNRVAVRISSLRSCLIVSM